MKVFYKLLMVSVLGLVIVSCSKDRTREQQLSAMISEIDSPFLVASMNLQNLMDKSEVMKEGTLPFTYYQVISFFLAVELTGIDYNTDAQFVMGKGESFLPSFYGIFKVDKEELFTTLLEVEANAEIKEKDGFKYAIKEKESYCLAWNEEFAVISSIPMDLAALLSGKGNGGEKQIDKNIAIIKAGEEGEINEDYVAFLENDADIAMMYDGKPFYQYMKTMSMEDSENLEKMKDIYEGMKYEIYLNFNKGNVELEMVADLDKELKEQLNFIGDKGVSAKLFDYGKSKSPLLTGGYKVDIAGFLDYFKGISEEDYNKMTEDLTEAGMEIEDIKVAFSGEMVYMVDEVVEREVVYDFGYNEPIVMKEQDASFGIVIGLSNKKIIEDKMKEIMMMQTTGNDLASNEQDPGFDMADMPKMEVLPNGVIQTGEAFIYLGSDILFMSNDSAWTNMVVAGTSVKVNNPNGILTDKAMGMYADLTKLSPMGDMDEEQAQMLKMFSSFSGSANLDGGKFTINMSDDSQNSLKLITIAVGTALAEIEKSMDPELESELEDAIENGEDAWDKLDEEFKDVDIEEIEEEVKKSI